MLDSGHEERAMLAFALFRKLNVVAETLKAVPPFCFRHHGFCYDYLMFCCLNIKSACRLQRKGDQIWEMGNRVCCGHIDILPGIMVNLVL